MFLIVRPFPAKSVYLTLQPGLYKSTFRLFTELSFKPESQPLHNSNDGRQ